MKLIPTAFAVACAVFISHSACAASLTMLQFGSFETRAEAQKRLTEVTAKHATQLSKLASNIREVKLPPDNLTVYRTQAGPVESRAAAQAICAQLASVGDECYIVQTAMVSAPEKASTLAQAATTAAAPVTSAAAQATDSAASTVAAAVPELPTISDSKPTARDPLNRAALETVSADRAQETLATAADTRTEFAQDDAAATQVNKALDEALNEKKVAENSAASAAENAAPSRSFWSRLNPFSSDEPSKAPVAKAPDAAAAPVEAVAATALAATAAAAEPDVTKAPAAVETEAVALPVPAVSAPTLETPESPPAAESREAPIVSAPAAVPSSAPAVVSLSRTPITLDTTPVILHAEPLPLPPPPAPLREQDRRELAAGIKPKLPAPEVIAASPIAAPAATASVNDGSVEVEEAKRVPVTQAIAVPQTAAPVAAAAPRVTPAASLSPTATDGQKTIWAQVGPFASERAAIDYWSAYRQSHPDFPVVRVRATTPLQSAAGSKAQSWLRVGPVANSAFVTSLCGSLTAQPGLRCGVVRDSGVAGDVKASTQAPISSRYKH